MLIASSTVTPLSCVAALVKCPPPPSASIVNWTFTEPSERADIPIRLSSRLATTYDASIPSKLNSSSAACATVTG